MFSHTTEFRVRYGETDRMGYLYYGNYAEYYEVGRVEAIRSLGFSYKQLEDSGILLPVLDMEVKYLKPAHYDDVLQLTTCITKLPDVRMHFSYEITNAAGELINIGKTTLVFYDVNKQRPCKAPEELTESIRKFF